MYVWYTITYFPQIFIKAAIASAGDSDTVARAVVNTILGGCSGGLTVLFANKFLLGAKWSYLMTLNGTLTGIYEHNVYFVSLCNSVYINLQSYLNNMPLDKSNKFLIKLINFIFLSGMVSQCGGCNVFQPWAALIVGCMGGFIFLGTHLLMLKMKFDDPLDAVAVHGAGGNAIYNLSD